MITISIAVAALVICAFFELAFPGNDVYHYGWYNVALIALIVIVLMRLAKTLRHASNRQRLAVSLLAAGGVMSGFAVVASGLLGPDTQTVVAAPGASVRIDSLGGSLVFPLARAEGADVLLVRGATQAAIGTARFEGPFLLKTVPRDVVAVDAGDDKGAHLTITQPTGNTFLSPVLLMQSQQTIAGMALPYDSFAIPAARRVVKAVLFGPAQIARLPALAGASHAVLFDVENQNEVSLKNGIGVAPDGGRVRIAGLELTAHVFSYPAIEIVSVPDLRVVIAGVILVFAGAGLTIVRRSV